MTDAQERVNSNARSLACDTAIEDALERHAAAVRQLSNGTNGDDLYIVNQR